MSEWDAVDAEAAFDRAAFVAALKPLPIEDQKVGVLGALRFPEDEIAAMLGTSPAAVRESAARVAAVLAEREPVVVAGRLCIECGKALSLARGVRRRRSDYKRHDHCKSKAWRTS